MSNDGFKVLATDWHRNGIGGSGFYVALVEDYNENRTFLVTDFSTPDAESEVPYGYTAVLDAKQAAAGNIFMYPKGGRPGGNAWRGDRLGDKYRQAIFDAQQAYWDSVLPGAGR